MSASYSYLLALLVLLFANVSGAAEPRLCDLRLFIEQRPSGAAFSWRDATGGSDGSVDFDHALGIGVGARWGWGRAGLPWMAVLGIEGLMVQESFAGGDRTASELRLELAYAQALTNDWLLVIGPVVGAGVGHTQLSGGAIRPVQLDGSLVEGGLRVGVRWSMTRRWSLGAEGGWLIGRDRASGDGAELTWQRSGRLVWRWLSLSTHMRGGWNDRAEITATNRGPARSGARPTSAGEPGDADAGPRGVRRLVRLAMG